MYPAEIETYARPKTLTEATNLLSNYPRGDALLVAGGQSIMQALKTRLIRPKCIIDLQAVLELRDIVLDSSGLRLGAMTNYVNIATNEKLNGPYQALRDAAFRVGDRQVRNRGTIGGSICWNYIAACMPPVALALDMQLELVSKDGSRKIPAENFLGAPLETNRDEYEILVALIAPTPTKNTGSAYKKWGLVTDALPVIGVCASLSTDDQGKCVNAKIAIGGLGNGPSRSYEAEKALLGITSSNTVAIAEAIKTASNQIETQTDMWADSDYRKQLIRSIGKEVIESAFLRASG